MYKNGMMSVPATNCRIVRPREIRARNRPTKDAHAIHHAQKNSLAAPEIPFQWNEPGSDMVAHHGI
jgi:hypothetical protein